MTLSPADLAIWAITGAATAGVMVRPLKLPETVWAVLGAAALLVFRLLPWGEGLKAMGEGTDVYLFLTGMMLLSETARRAGLFDWVAAAAVNHARGSPRRLFLLTYAVGVAVTSLLSNDAAAVVLTPAVLAAARKAKVEALPLLFICALVANAGSFVLPISNPANIVLYGGHTPALGRWLASFALPSAVSILATYGMLRLTEGSRLAGDCERQVEQPPLSAGGRTALAGVGLTAFVLLSVSSLDMALGLPTCTMGLLTTGLVLAVRREGPWATIKGVAWAVLPLVAALFVMVEAVNRTGLATEIGGAVAEAARRNVAATAAIAGGGLAVVSNLINNLPAGLIASTAISGAHPPKPVVDALLIGVDLGPNLSITGSLATVLWLTALRREGEDVSLRRFLKVGVLVTPPALVLAIAARLAFG